MNVQNLFSYFRFAEVLTKSRFSQSFLENKIAHVSLFDSNEKIRIKVGFHRAQKAPAIFLTAIFAHAQWLQKYRSLRDFCDHKDQKSSST